MHFSNSKYKYLQYNKNKNYFTSSSLKFLLPILLFVVPITVDGQIIFRSGESVGVDKEEYVDGNFYSAGSRVNISGEIIGDWVGLGGSVTGNGTFLQDVLVAGANVNIHGSTTQDVRIVGGEVVIADYIGGDLAILAGSVDVLSSAFVAGDILIYSTDVTIAGDVGGSVFGRYGRLRIDGDIGGDVDIHVNELVLGNKTKVAGNINYKSIQELTRAQDAQVEGNINYVEDVRESSYAIYARQLLTPVLIILFASLSLFLLQKRRLVSVVNHTLDKPLLFSLIGVSVVLVTPFIAILLILSVLGSLLGLVLLSLYMFLIFLSIILAIPVLGLLFSKHILGRPNIDIISIGCGALIFYAILLLPVMGPALALSIIFITLGGVTNWFYQR